MKKKIKKKQPAKRTKYKSENVKVVERERLCFLGRTILWFLDHQQQIDQLFARDDKDNRGSVSRKDFELGLVNLGVPCQQAELHSLTQLLQTPHHTINYHHVSTQLQALRDSTEPQNASSLEPRESNRDRQRFVHLSVRLIHFDSFSAHPGNFEVSLWSGCRVFSLMEMIRQRVGIQTTGVEVFGSRQTGEESRLPPERSLEECGYAGGPEESPPHATLYYDYRLMLADCPVLNCDHYFRSDASARRSRHNL